MSAELSIPLGPFQLLRPVGRGGMGMVWLGQHRDQGVPVAVKVITGRAASSPEYQAAFAKEVQAAAQLEHPGIVWLFDYGRVPRDAARASDFQLVEGSPYLVMEYASQGTLRNAAGLPWPELRSLLLALLDALAHAHARGVVHRDIKPDNVLVAGPADLRPGYKLTDYGIAHPLDDSVSQAGEEKPMGTPHYMAPEQIRAEVHRYGPHTDLYAFGCMVYKLVTGRLPYAGLKGPPLMYAQLAKPPPPLEPLVPLPAGFGDWLSVLMAKDPADRFGRAADAALALAQLRAPAEGGAAGARLVALGAEDELPTEEALETATLQVVTARVARAERPVASPQLRPPLPPTWRLADATNRPLRLMGAGLGLYGLRPVAFVGREAERDQLWGALRDVHRDRLAQVVLVRGDAGIGRSRLVQWVAERAHEVGGAQVMRASFTATSAAAEVLRKMVVRFVRSWRQQDSAPLTTVTEALRAAHGLPEMAPHVVLDRLLDGESSPMEPAHRYDLILQVFTTIAASRPLVVILDDAQWSMDALKLAQAALQDREGKPLPVLFLLTVLDDVLEPYDEVSRRLEQITDRGGASSVHLGPLPEADRHDLVQALLGLDRGLADRVVARTDGNPLFATQLIGDWTERGVLVAGPSGFVLRDPGIRLPETLGEVWEGRIRQLVEGIDVPALEMLERAAVLGREVDVWEWQQVCDDPRGEHARVQHVYFRPQHAKIRSQLMERLFTNRLGQPTEDGFVFTHAQFRDALVRRAERAGRLAAHHDACANVLLFQLSVASAERVARHLVGAGRAEEAMPSMFLAVDHRTHSRGHQAALGLLEDAVKAMESTGLPETDRWWAELAARQAVSLDAADRHADAWRMARHAWDLASAGGWDDLKAQAALVQGAVSVTAGRNEEAEQHYLKVVRLLGNGSDVLVALKAWHQLRRLAVMRGDRSLAASRGESLREVASRATGGPAGAFAQVALAGLALGDGDLEQARLRGERSLDIARLCGDVLGQARAHSLLAELAVRRDEVDAAREQFGLAVDRYEAIGDSGSQWVRCQWAAFEARLGHFDRAQRAVEPGLAREPDDRNLRAALNVCMVMATAGRGRWPQFERHLSACEKMLPLVSARIPIYAELAELAGDLCVQRRQRERAVRAWNLAIARWKAIGDETSAARVVHRRDTLGAPS